MSLTFLDLTLWQLLTRLAAFLIVTGVHGLALAACVRAAGDPTPGYLGRTTPNPFAHLSLAGLVAGALFKTGWIRPMAVDAGEHRLGIVRAAACVAGSLAATLALVPLLSILRPLTVTTVPLLSAQTLLAIMDATQDLAIWFVVFNILPLPPLTGFMLVAAAWPRAAGVVGRWPVAAEVVMLLLVAFGWVAVVLAPLNRALRLLVVY